MKQSNRFPTVALAATHEYVRPVCPARETNVIRLRVRRFRSRPRKHHEHAASPTSAE